MLRLEARWLTSIVKVIFQLHDRIELGAAVETIMASSKQSHERKRTGQRGLFDLIETDEPNELSKITVRPVRLSNQELFEYLESGGLPELIKWSNDKVIRFNTREINKRNQRLIDALKDEREYMDGYIWYTPTDLVIALGFLETAYKGMMNERANQRTT